MNRAPAAGIAALIAAIAVGAKAMRQEARVAALAHPVEIVPQRIITTVGTRCVASPARDVRPCRRGKSRLRPF